MGNSITWCFTRSSVYSMNPCQK
uniref:Uncharacterized protein n=1 Tax=Anguilla anguilla TaxID=7936 RepID=A0A0E9VIC0_ANGAN